MGISKVVIDSSVFIKFDKRMNEFMSLFAGLGELSTSILISETMAKDCFSQRNDFKEIQEHIVVDDGLSFETIYDLKNKELQDLGLSARDCAALELAKRTKAPLLTLDKLVMTAAKRMHIQLVDQLNGVLFVPANKDTPIDTNAQRNSLETIRMSDNSQIFHNMVVGVGTINNMYNSKIASTMT